MDANAPLHSTYGCASLEAGLANHPGESAASLNTDALVGDAL